MEIGLYLPMPISTCGNRPLRVSKPYQDGNANWRSCANPGAFLLGCAFLGSNPAIGYAFTSIQLRGGQCPCLPIPSLERRTRRRRKNCGLNGNDIGSIPVPRLLGKLPTTHIPADDLARIFALRYETSTKAC